MITELQDISDIFSIFHDGSIESYSGDYQLLTLKVGCLYLAELIDPTFEYFYLELAEIEVLEFDSWTSPPERPNILKTELADIFQSDLEIMEGEV